MIEIEDAKTRCIHSLSCKCVRSYLSVLQHTKNVLGEISTMLTIPAALALFALNCVVVIPLGILAIILYKVAGMIVFLISQSPVIYLLIREAWRQLHSLPMSESWETSLEKWNKSLTYYATASKKTKDR